MVWLIYLKTVTGKTIPVKCDPSNTVDYVKALVEAQEGLPRVLQRLVFAGENLEDGEHCGYLLLLLSRWDL